MKLKFSKKAYKKLNKIPDKIRRNIIKALHSIPQGDIKTLNGYNDGRQRLRVGDYRVVFIHQKEIEILYVIRIGPRGDVYK